MHLYPFLSSIEFLFDAAQLFNVSLDFHRLMGCMCKYKFLSLVLLTAFGGICREKAQNALEHYMLLANYLKFTSR